MANYLQDFSQGLRSAAGVLNPQIQRDTFAADEREQAQRRQFDQAAALQQISPQAQLARQQLENELLYRQAISKLPPDATIGDRARIAETYGKPELAVSLYNAQEQRVARAEATKEANETRKLALQQTHESRMARISSDVLRQAETARHNAAMEALNAQNATVSQDLRRMAIDLQRDRLVAAGGGAGLSGEAAGKVAMADQAIMDIRDARGLLVNKDGSVNKLLIAAMNVPYTSGMPFSTEARNAYSQLQNAVAAKLRIETGAAATESEVKGILNRFLPKISDNPDTVRQKLDRLEEFMNTTIDQTKGVRLDQLRSRQQPKPIVAPGTALPGATIKFDAQGNRIP